MWRIFQAGIHTEGIPNSEISGRVSNSIAVYKRAGCYEVEGKASVDSIEALDNTVLRQRLIVIQRTITNTHFLHSDRHITNLLQKVWSLIVNVLAVKHCKIKSVKKSKASVKSVDELEVTG